MQEDNIICLIPPEQILGDAEEISKYYLFIISYMARRLRAYEKIELIENEKYKLMN